MNMVDTKKTHRGVLLWREDILKCARCAKRPLSSVVRELLHREMSKYSLGKRDREDLMSQISEAMIRRKQRNPNAGTRRPRALAVDRVSIPDCVRKNPKFVEA